MNLYFLVEGVTESEFYPAFIDYYLNGKLIRVNEYKKAQNNHYYLIGASGYPCIYTMALKNAIEEINDNPVYDYLILCLDADDSTIDEKVMEFKRYIEQYEREGTILTPKCCFKIVVQNKCIETWFLGNKKMYSSNPNEEPLISYTRYYNVKKNDPELMGNYLAEYSPQDFHLQYLRAMLRAKRMIYKKECIEKTVAHFNYMEQLVKRAKNQKEKHLQSFADFVVFFDTIKDIEQH